jgi:hypothetical protein
MTENLLETLQVSSDPVENKLKLLYIELYLFCGNCILMHSISIVSCVLLEGIENLLLFFFFDNVGVRVSLHAPRLIPQALKLTTIKTFNNPEIFETRTHDLQRELVTLILCCFCVKSCS